MKRALIRKQKKQEKINKLFLEKLKKEGYIIDLWYNNQYFIKGNRIYGFIDFNIPEESKCPPEYRTYNWNSGMIVIDHKDCFDKTSKCPCKMFVPTTKYKINEIIEQLKFWGSDEGFKLSNEYECKEWIDEYAELLNKKRFE